MSFFSFRQQKNNISNQDQIKYLAAMQALSDVLSQTVGHLIKQTKQPINMVILRIATQNLQENFDRLRQNFSQHPSFSIIQDQLEQINEFLANINSQTIDPSALHELGQSDQAIKTARESIADHAHLDRLVKACQKLNHEIKEISNNSQDLKDTQHNLTENIEAMSENIQSLKQTPASPLLRE